MPDSFSEVTRQSWFSRLGAAIKAVLVGVVFFLVSFPLLWWNEGRAVRTAKGLRELGGSAVTVSAEKVDPAYEKKPVHMTAEATSEETLSDPDFPVSAQAIKLRRQVEMYQWQERKSSETKKRIGGGTETVTTYNYEKGWSDERIHSEQFKKPEGHANPAAMPFASHEQTAQVVRFGAFRLSPGLASQMTHYEPLPFDAQELKKLAPELRGRAKVDAGVLYIPGDPKRFSVNPASPNVGDVRIRFEVVKPCTVSIIAQQAGDSFAPWQSQAGTATERLMVGSVSREGMVTKMEAENTMFTWVLRLLGFLLMAFGIGLVFRPLSVVADVLPILGDLLRLGIGVFAAVVAAFFSLITIAIAWLAYRPLLGIGLIALAVAVVVGCKMLARKKQEAAASAA